MRIQFATGMLVSVVLRVKYLMIGPSCASALWADAQTDLGKLHAVSFDAINALRNLKSRSGASGVALDKPAGFARADNWLTHPLMPNCSGDGLSLCKVAVRPVIVRWMSGCVDCGVVHSGAGVGGFSNLLSGSATT